MDWSNIEYDLRSDLFLSLENLDNEYWIPIKGFELSYHISNYGRVKSLPKATKLKETILKPRDNGFGYFHHGLQKDKKQIDIRLHKLVAINFIPNEYPEIKNEINHINGNTKDNRVENLEWVTPSQNIKHSISIGKTKREKDNRRFYYSEKQVI